MTAGFEPSSEEQRAFPTLSPAHFAALAARSSAQDVEVGDLLWRAGDRAYDFVVIESGEVEIVREKTPDRPEEVVARHDAGRFLGELNMLTGQRAYLTARVSRAGRIYRLDPDGFRRLMAEDAELSDLILKAFLARRMFLQTGEGARSLEILGTPMSTAAHALRNWAARQHIPHMWLDFDSAEGKVLATALNATAADLPVVVTVTDVLRNATAGEVAEQIGLSYQVVEGRVYDVVVVGAGPGGLAAAVYGASRASTRCCSTRWPSVARRPRARESRTTWGFRRPDRRGPDRPGQLQAQKFGAHVSTPCTVTHLHTEAGTCG